MAFNFNKIFQDALEAGILAAKPGGQMVEDWIRESAKANEKSLHSIAKDVLDKQISKETGAMLLRECARALESEAAALQVVLKTTAQAAVNAFMSSLQGALSMALKLAI